MAPFNGFQKDDFDAFLYIEDDPKKIIRSTVKEKFRKLLVELEGSLKKNNDYKNLVTYVGDLKVRSKSIWGTFASQESKNVDIPHYNFSINRNGFSVGFIVEGKKPAKKLYAAIKKDKDRFLKILRSLKGYEIELQHRVYLAPRKYDNQTVVILKCGKEITLNDVNYLIQKTEQYDLILTWCRITILRDDPRLNTKLFLNTLVEYLEQLMILYKFAYSNYKSKSASI